MHMFWLGKSWVRSPQLRSPQRAILLVFTARNSGIVASKTKLDKPPKPMNSWTNSDSLGIRPGIFARMSRYALAHQHMAAR